MQEKLSQKYNPIIYQMGVPGNSEKQQPYSSYIGKQMLRGVRADSSALSVPTQAFPYILHSWSFIFASAHQRQGARTSSPVAFLQFHWSDRHSKLSTVCVRRTAVAPPLIRQTFETKVESGLTILMWSTSLIWMGTSEHGPWSPARNALWSTH